MLTLLISSLIVSYSQDTTTKLLNELVISADRIENSIQKEGKSIQIITKEQLKNIPAQSIAEILVQVAGIDIRQRGANGVQADIGLRGSTFDQVLVLINGVKMNDAQTGHHTMNLPIDISVIEKIEIVKGAGARIYGQNAFAGVVNIITKNPKDVSLKFKVVGGDFNLGEISATGTFVTKKSSHLLNVNHGFSDGYKYNTDYYTTNIFYSNTIKINKKDNIELMTGFVEKKFGANGFYASPAFKDQYEETQTSIVSAKYKHKIGKSSKINYGIYWRRNQDEYLFLRENPSFYRNHHIGNTVGLNVNTVLKSKIGKTGLGLDISRVYIESNNLGKRQRHLQTFFAEHQFNFFKDKLHVTPGLQLVYNSGFGGIFLPGIDVNYELNSMFSIFANSGKTYRTPTYTDLYYRGRTNIGNENLQPEVALTHEAGFRFDNEGFNFQASYFYRDGKNIIDWTKTSFINPWQPTNLMEVKMQGLDTDLQIDSRKITGNNHVLKYINLGFTKLNSDTKLDSSIISKYAYEYLANQFTSSIVFEYFDNLTHSILFRHVDRVNLPNYNILDSKIQYDNGTYLAFIEVSNIFDIKYKETNLVVMPGRWLRIGLGYTFSYPSIPVCPREIHPYILG